MAEHPHHARRAARQQAGGNHLEDLRAQLPAEFRDAPDAEIAQLWLAWDAIRHGHPISYLTDTLAVPDELAHRLVQLVSPPPNPSED
jgi:DNA-binding transcriptional LysR family regulator